MKSYKNTLLLTTAALVASVSFTPAMMGAPMPGPDDHDRQYHDKRHNDDHHWDNHEDQAYRVWLKEKHHKDIEFEKLNERDQQSYWTWRHSHSNALLKIDIH